MISLLLESVCRSLLVGVVVWGGLRALRVRNVVAQKSAWGMVLVAALLMPVLMPWAATWKLFPRTGLIVTADPQTLLQELQARIQSKAAPAPARKPAVVTAPPAETPHAVKTTAPSQVMDVPRSSSAASQVQDSDRPSSSGKESSASGGASVISDEPSPDQYVPVASTPAQQPHSYALEISAADLVLISYLGVVILFLLRLAYGLCGALRLWYTARPIASVDFAAPLRLRVSRAIASPVTIGSGVVLPETFKTWDSEKLRIVLAHERSHVQQGDFYLQILAGLYAAFTWFSPLGWWIKNRLSELAEAISDRAGLEQAVSPASYAQVLLEFAALPRPTNIGVAMARRGTLSRRIERLLNPSALRQEFSGSRSRLFAALLLVPAALFTATALIHVQAAGAITDASTALFAQQSPAAPAAAQAPAPASAPQAEETPAPEDAPTPDEAPNPNPVVVVAPAPVAVPNPAPVVVPVPPIPAVNVDPQVVVVPNVNVEVPAAPRMVAIAPVPPMPAMNIRVVTPRKSFHFAFIGGQEHQTFPFDRTLSVSGNPQLFVATGSGNIHIRPGTGSQIVVHGSVEVSHEGSVDEAKQIAANPPIEQDGNTIHIGQQHDHEHDHWHGISINYEIEAPASTVLVASSGSGDITDDGVGQNSKLETGSGNITATRLEGSSILETGSGNITAAQTGQGDVKAETGSGDIEIKDVHGSFRAQTGSGDIKANGTPSADWNLQTGSGNVELWTNNAGMTLEASTGSGEVSTEHAMMTQGSFNTHHIRGTLNGGGPTVKVQTGSGDVHIH